MLYAVAVISGHDSSSEPLAPPPGSAAENELTDARTSATHALPSALRQADRLDPLSDVLRVVRLSGALFFLVDASSPWRAEAPSGFELAPVILPGARQVVSFHLVTAGRCWCTFEGEPPFLLETGDVLVVPRGDAYVLSSAPGVRPEYSLDAILEFYRELAAVHPSILTEGGGGSERIGVACGFLGCDALPSSPILTTLPRFLHLRLSAAETPERLKSLLDYAISESSDRRAGSDCVLLRISELMFVEVVRRYLASLNADHPGWLGGLRDPQIGRVLAILHREPGYPWTLETLAKRAGMSRSILAERFLHFIGQPPMQYLAQWRMQVAARILADDVTAKVAAVALEVGYDSEAAFSRAFKKVVGVPPSAWRARQRRGS